MEIVASNHSLLDRQNIKRLGIDAPHITAAEQEKKSPATVENDSAADTSVDDFLYGVNGHYVSTQAYESMDFMHLVFSDYSIEQLSKDISPVMANGIEMTRKSLLTMPPERLEEFRNGSQFERDLRAAQTVSSVSYNVERLDDMTRSLNSRIRLSNTQDYRDDNVSRQRNEFWIEHLKENIQNLARGLKSDKVVNGDLLKMNADGTYALSAFSIEYDGKIIAEHSGQ